MPKAEFKATKEQSNMSTFKSHPMYSTDVLMGNWFEDRLTGEVDPRAIAPAVYGVSGCSVDQSAYRSNFVVPHPDTDKASEDFTNLSLDAFANGLTARKASFLLSHGEEFLKNMTTTSDIMFNLRIKEAKAHQDEVQLPGPKKAPKEDFLKSYGNITQTGLLKYKALQRCCFDKMPVSSTYRREYGPKPRVFFKQDE